MLVLLQLVFGAIAALFYHAEIAVFLFDFFWFCFCFSSVAHFVFCQILACCYGLQTFKSYISDLIGDDEEEETEEEIVSMGNSLKRCTGHQIVGMIVLSLLF